MSASGSKEGRAEGRDEETANFMEDLMQFANGLEAHEVEDSSAILFDNDEQIDSQGISQGSPCYFHLSPSSQEEVSKPIGVVEIEPYIEPPSMYCYF